jgi:hypothetical protein
MTTLGVLGARNAISKQILQDEILNPILDDLDSKIERILFPSEPVSSAYIDCWAQRQNIPTEAIKPDWIAQGRRAGVLRDAQIEKTSGALLIFEGPKSQYYKELAERIAKRSPEKKIYLISAGTVTPVLLEVEQGNTFTVSEVEEKEIFTIDKAFSKQKQVLCLIRD